MKQSVLLENLDSIKQAMLASLMTHPGWKVLEELHFDACKRATEDVIKLDPTAEGYDKAVMALQIRARERNEFSLLVLGSVESHAQAFEKAEKQKNQREKQSAGNPILGGKYSNKEE